MEIFRSCEGCVKEPFIIIPAYNEEKNIAGVINGIKNSIPDADGRHDPKYIPKLLDVVFSGEDDDGMLIL